MSGEGFGGTLQAVHGQLERLAAPVAFPVRELAVSALLSPATWSLTARRIRSHAGTSPGAAAPWWRGVTLFLASDAGRILLDYALRRLVQNVVAEVQAAAAAVEEDKGRGGGGSGGAGERAARVARGAAAAAVATLLSWTARLWLRTRLRRAVLGEAVSGRVVAGPSLWGVLFGALVAVFPFAPLGFLRGPTRLFVQNLFDLAEVRMAMDEELGVLSAVEHAIDADPRGWGVLVAGLPHGEHPCWFRSLLPSHAARQLLPCTCFKHSSENQLPSFFFKSATT